MRKTSSQTSPIINDSLKYLDGNFFYGGKLSLSVKDDDGFSFNCIVFTSYILI